MAEAMDVASTHMSPEDAAMLEQMKPMFEEFGKTLQESAVVTGMGTAMARADLQDTDMGTMQAEITALKRSLDEFNTWAINYRAEQRGNILVVANGLKRWAMESDPTNVGIIALFDTWIVAMESEGQPPQPAQAPPAGQ